MSFGGRNLRDAVVRTRITEDHTHEDTLDPRNPFIIELELADDLPDVCARHGRLAVDKVEKALLFRSRYPWDSPTEPPWVQRTAFQEVSFMLRLMIRVVTMQTPDPRPPSTLLRGTWPVCARCRLKKKIWQRISLALFLAGPAVLVTLLIVCLLTKSMDIRIPVTLAFFPGWLPFGFWAAVVIYQHAQTFALFRPITEYTRVEIRAHPRFADAVESRGTTTEIREW
ncbi:hypothetical protein AB0L57_13265 [Nocardia sp. NPDC052254]|uniref:hypothetical protein n=1 Tax=Nocardia sp. NPDC052254 TaxID=3155681 RepID=UPI00343D9EE1